MKYPIYNKKAYALLYLIDTVLNLIPGKKAALKTPRKLLICNSAHLGDVILTTSLLPPLKKTFPELFIGMLVASASKQVIEKHPLVNAVHTVDHWKVARRGMWGYWQSRQKALKEIQTVHYDAAVDCNFHFPNMAPLLWQSKIAIRIGFESAGLSRFLTHSLPWDARENRSAVLAFFSLLDFLGTFDKDLLKPNLSFIKKEKEAYIVFHMGCGHPDKEWCLEKWRRLAMQLYKEGYALYFTGKGKNEKKAIDTLLHDLPKAKNLCDHLNWEQFVSTVQQAELLVGVDSSAGHVAAAVETPAVLLYTNKHPESLWKPYGGQVRILKPLENISSEDVYAAVKSMSALPTSPFSSASNS